jgi:hypothetical protein
VILVLVHIASHFEMKSLVCTYFRRFRMCGLIDAYIETCGSSARGRQEFYPDSRQAI